MSSRMLVTSATLLAASLVGCQASSTRPPAAPEVSPSATQISSPPNGPAAPRSVPRHFAEGSSVSFADLLALAREEPPTQAIFVANRAAAAAARTQAAAWANPELQFSVGRAKAREATESGSRPTATIGGVSINQRFELPGKRSARIAAAESAQTLADSTAAVDELELVISVQEAAMAVVLADQRVEQATRAEALAARIQTVMASRHRAGETGRGDLARAAAELVNARLIADGAKRSADAARTGLRAWCGTTLPGQFSVREVLSEAKVGVTLPQAQQAALASHPRLALIAAQSHAASAALLREQRAWYPDLTLGVSANREMDTDDLGLSLGVEIPLWNRNAGGIAQAEADLARSAAERRLELAALQRQVLAAWSSCDRRRAQVAGLTREILPARQEALRLKMSAFEAGDLGFFDLIETQQDLLSAEQALIDATEGVFAAHAELTRAVGHRLDAEAPAGDPVTPVPHAVPPTLVPAAGATP